MALDECHEQKNACVKGDGCAVCLTENFIGTTAKMDGVWTRNGQDYWRISQCFRQEANFIITRTRQVTNLNFGSLSFSFHTF